MDFPFPLLKPRQGDRHFSDSESSWHHRSLDIPESSNGQVRLQLTIPWGEIESGEHIISVLLTWPNLKPPPRDLKGLSEEAWERLVPGKYKRTERSSLVGGLVRLPIRFNRWRAELFIRKEDRQLVESLIRGEARIAELVSNGAIDFAICTVREQTISSLVGGLEWATRFSHRGWSHDNKKNKLAWVYRAHLKTAMIVAEEIAQLYLANKLHPKDRSSLEKAYPTLEKIIKDAYGCRAERDPKITAQRLALALVHIKFKKVFYTPVLDPNWQEESLLKGTVWSHLLPNKDRSRLEQLRPGPSVQEMMSWPKGKRRDNELATGFCNWWVCLVHEPLRPLYPPTDVPLTKRNYIAFLEFPGVERWASIVWDALHGPGIPISSD